MQLMLDLVLNDTLEVVYGIFPGADCLSGLPYRPLRQSDLLAGSGT